MKRFFKSYKSGNERKMIINTSLISKLINESKHMSVFSHIDFTEHAHSAADNKKAIIEIYEPSIEQIPISFDNSSNNEKTLLLTKNKQ